MVVPWLFYFTASLKAFPGLNAETFLADIFSFLPAWGFLSILTFLFLAAKVPKPARVKASFFFNALAVSNAVYFAAFASFFVDVALDAASIRPALFIYIAAFF